MKGLLGFLFFMLFLAGFAFVMLQGRQMAESNLGSGGAGVTGIDWRPVLVGTDTVPNDSGMFLRVAVDGSVNGNAGCNGFFGSLEKTDTGISIGPLGTTRRACPKPIMARESAFLEALQKTTRFQASRDSLQLLGDGDVRLAELVAGTASRRDGAL